MACKPDVGGGIKFRDVAIEFCGGLVVSIFSRQGADETSLITCECGRRAVTDLSPEVMAALPTATAEEEIVVDFILCRRTSAIKDCRSGALESYDDSFVAFIREDVATKTIAFPAKTVGIVEACIDVFPLAGVWVLGICICCHEGKTDDGFFVRDVGSRYFIESPG